MTLDFQLILFDQLRFDGFCQFKPLLGTDLPLPASQLEPTLDFCPGERLAFTALLYHVQRPGYSLVGRKASAA
jgi:hypothetical protein